MQRIDKAYQTVTLLGLAVILGVFFRFYHLDHKVFSGDEVYTSLHILGETEAPLVARAGTLHSVRDLQPILHPVPPQGTLDALSPARALALEDPEHPPVYYELAHQWVGVFGNSVFSIRALSVLFSLLALPCAYWLGVELYRTRRAGWIALALIALSPVAILYAQEAREYGLWSAALLALSAAVLRAVRLDRPANWWLVAALEAFALYVFPLSLAAEAGLAAYVLATQWRKRGTLVRAGLAFALGFFAFVPWLAILVGHRGAVRAGMASMVGARLARGAVLRTFAGKLRLNLIDFNQVRTSAIGTAETALALLALGYALFAVIRYERMRVWLFLLLPLLATVLPIVLPDLIFSGQRVRNSRYFMPMYLYLDFALVGLFAIGTAAKDVRRRTVWLALLIALLGTRAVSAAVSSQATTWWNKNQDNTMFVASRIDRAQRPMIVSDDYLLYTLALSNYLRPDVAVGLRPRCYLCTAPGMPQARAADLPAGRFTDIYALGSSLPLERIVQRLAVRRSPGAAYHCVNVRNNCVSDLNIEPVLVPVTAVSVP